MPSLPILKILANELISARQVSRVPEPSLVMDDPQQVEAYTRAGREDGVMAPVYLFHCAQVCSVIRPGDHVLDLACGPANQLCQIARLNPECRFTGVDLSLEMIEKAKELVASQGIRNVDFVEGSIADLKRFEDGSFDAVMSTMALHHLPDFPTLKQTFAEAARVLHPTGGLYLVDFGRLKRADSIEYFAYQYKDRQPLLFTVDYYNSLHAAFTRDEFRQACAYALGDRARVFSTWAVPYMVIIKTKKRRHLPPSVVQSLHEIRDSLPNFHRKDLADLRKFFRLGGVSSSALS
jgi:SAM-dependent methyltransferase